MCEGLRINEFILPSFEIYSLRVSEVSLLGFYQLFRVVRVVSFADRMIPGAGVKSHYVLVQNFINQWCNKRLGSSPLYINSVSASLPHGGFKLESISSLDESRRFLPSLMSYAPRVAHNYFASGNSAHTLDTWFSLFRPTLGSDCFSSDENWPRLLGNLVVDGDEQLSTAAIYICEHSTEFRRQIIESLSYLADAQLPHLDLQQKSSLVLLGFLAGMYDKKLCSSNVSYGKNH